MYLLRNTVVEPDAHPISEIAPSINLVSSMHWQRKHSCGAENLYAYLGKKYLLRGE